MAPWCRACRPAAPASPACRSRSTGSDFCHSRGSPMRRTVADHSLAQGSDDAPHPAHRFLEHRADLVERDGVRAVAAAGGVVRDHRDGRVLQAELARQRGLGHAGHADEVGAVALEAVDLGRGLEARPLASRRRRRRRRALRRSARAALSSRSRSAREYGSVKSMCVTGSPAPSKKVVRAAPGVVDDLVRQHQRAGPGVVADAADRCDRHDLGRARVLAAPRGWRGS